MKTEQFEQFSRAYTAGLLAAVQASPDEYMLSGRTPDEYASQVAAKMLAAIQANPKSVNYTGGGFKRACKTLGIKYTRKAIWEFLGV
jgi:hypothetical protein